MQRIVKPHVNGRVLAILAVVSFAIALVPIGLSVWLASSDFSSGLGSPGIFLQALLLALAVLCVLLAIWGTWGAWFWLRLERRRQAAARGTSTQTFLAAEQPSPHTVPLSLPVIISIRAKKPVKLIAWLSVALFTIIASAGAAIDHGVWDVRFFLTLLGALGAGSSIALLFTGGSYFEVTHDCLKVQVGNLEQTVPWEEARLFAITRGRRASLRYELASSQASILWAWIRPGTLSAYFYEPTMPQYEYDHQMEALLGLITAKTGLPLYDLR